ncbi:membrane-bound serine protease (ClpP class) [Alteribacillus persepolensis]|uniref:Membrane-bound serine protease (ClpP class) n=1 Tax=Alteribacillus persepolensis TaxID=568899 RepID=A0A1G8CRM8_9BACI|nr:nodulation protein NfeD [Alteribacillus persepolensis]SDH47580.1 membrane-bound serine protease (ClpP class) [Alteribacillus persepolensis]
MGKHRLRTAWILLWFSVLFVSLQPVVLSQSPQEQTVYVVPVEQTVERGLEAFLERSVNEAEKTNADHIIFEIDTPGGAVDAAGNIASIITNASVPTTAFVTEEAMSAGAFIALNANKIAMAPGTEMGAAQVIDGSGNAADDKAQSAWIANMKNAAELNERNPVYAIAMADPSIELEEYRAGEGSLLSLTASEAVEVGYAEYVVDDREELLLELGLEGAEVVEADISLAEHIARFVTHPVIIPILLSVGSLGLILELYSPGFGIPGILGALSLFLFFFGHAIAGFAGLESIVLFVAGLILLAIEIFVPGFGVFGFLGIGAMIGSMILASFSTLNIVLSILIAAVVSIAAAAILFKTFGMRGPMKRLVLEDSVTTDEGYISNVSRKELIGKTGITLTPLRPSGSINVDEERLDVVTEGGYVDQGEQVTVVDVEGSRIIVRKVEAD